jgi:hypothetical protein
LWRDGSQHTLIFSRTHTHTHTHKANNNAELKKCERNVKVLGILCALFKDCLETVSGESRECECEALGVTLTRQANGLWGKPASIVWFTENFTEIDLALNLASDTKKLFSAWAMTQPCVILFAFEQYQQAKFRSCSLIKTCTLKRTTLTEFGHTRPLCTKVIIYRVRINYLRISLRHNLSRKCRKIVKFMSITHSERTIWNATVVPTAISREKCKTVLERNGCLTDGAYEYLVCPGICGGSTRVSTAIWTSWSSWDVDPKVVWTISLQRMHLSSSFTKYTYNHVKIQVAYIL